MWRAVSALVMLDAGREVRHRAGTMAFYGIAGGMALIAMLFALQAAQLYLARDLSPPLASLTVAAGLLVVAGLVILAASFRQRRNRTGSEIGQAILAAAPLASAVVRTVNPQMLAAASVLIGAVVIGNRLGRKG